MLSILLYVSILAITILYLAGIEGFGCYTEDTMVGCAEFTSSDSMCTNIISVRCHFEDDVNVERIWPAGICPPRNNWDIVDELSCNTYYQYLYRHENKAQWYVPSKCCGTFRNMPTCNHLSTNIGLIISYACGAHFFGATIYLAYSYYKRITRTKDEEDSCKTSANEDLKDTPAIDYDRVML